MSPVQFSSPHAAAILSGRVAVVTGAARGIGRASAVALAKAGADVVCLDIAGPVSTMLEVPPATAGELSETGRLIEAAERIVATFGGIDILVANAGIQAFEPLLEMDDAHWHDQIDVNLTGTANAIRAFAPHIAASPRARRATATGASS